MIAIQASSRTFGAGASFFPARRQGCSIRNTLMSCFGSRAASEARSPDSIPAPAP